MTPEPTVNGVNLRDMKVRISGISSDKGRTYDRFF
jgi:hypothetical protein